MLITLLFTTLSVFWNSDTLRDMGDFMHEQAFGVEEKHLTSEMERGLYPEEKKKYYYSNVITNPFTLEKYFVRRDKGEDKCLIQDQPTFIQSGCELSAYQNDAIGICAQERFDNDPTTCDLMVRRSDGKNEFVTNLLKAAPEAPDDENNIGAELLQFVSEDRIAMFFGYDYPDSHQGIIRAFNLKTGELESPVISYFGEGSGLMFMIYKNGKTLLFANEWDETISDDLSFNVTIKERGIYLISSNHKVAKKIVPPKGYDFDKRPFVYVDVRENYQNDGLANLSIDDKRFTFDFKKESFVNAQVATIKNDNFTCPEDEESVESYTETMINQARDYEKINPDASDEEFAAYRYDQLVAHNCRKTIDDIQSHPKSEESPYHDLIK